ncbi:hypothetical protein ACTHAM_003435 [Cellulomonas soli]|uniref:hypothetical protein n=1 Tax=Cellulomonas soli TaxID=931535 RepID=UPI003F846F36
MHGSPSLPRSVLLALWLDAPAPDPAALLRAVQGDDEPHTVRGPDTHEGAAQAPLAELVTQCLAGPRQVAALLPTPGEPAPMTGPQAGLAADQGEALLLRTPGRCLALVPEVVRFGSEREHGHLVTWHAVEVPDWRAAVLGTVGTLQDAERALREGLVEATEALTRLDVARWRPDAADRIVAARDGALPPALLPDDLDPRRVRVLTSALRLRAIVRLAGEDDGAAVNLWQADQRSTALREVDRSARRAMAAAATSDLRDPL